MTARLRRVVLSVSLAILVITSGLFFFLPRTARAAFQHLVSHRYRLTGFSTVSRWARSAKSSGQRARDAR